MTIKRWVIFLSGLILVAIFSVLGWWMYKLYSKAERFEIKYHECLNAPRDTTVVYIDRIVFSEDTLRPKPTRNWIKTVMVRDTIHDTVFSEKPIEVNYYADTYQKEGLKIRYEAIVRGELRQIRFPMTVIPERIVTVTQSVPVHDTIKTNIEKNHLGITGSVIYWPGIYGGSAGLQYSFRGKWAIKGDFKVISMEQPEGMRFLQPLGELGVVLNIN